MFYIFLLISISTILSYLILKFIYRILFKSKKKVSRFLVFLGSIGLIIFYYTPYSYYLEPSYWEFRKMCKLNELPNDEYKYNKILSYFDKKLGDRDDFPHTKEYSSRIETLTLYVFYHQYFREHEETSLEGRLALSTMASQTPKEKYKLSYDSIKSMFLSLSWHTRRYYFEIANLTRYGDMWIEKTLACYKVAKENMTPRGVTYE